MRFVLLIVLFAVTSLMAQNQARFGASIPLDTSMLGKPEQITSDGASRKPHWSVDGKKLMIISSETGKCPQAYWMDSRRRSGSWLSGRGSVRSAAPLVKSKELGLRFDAGFRRCLCADCWGVTGGFQYLHHQ